MWKLHMQLIDIVAMFIFFKYVPQRFSAFRSYRTLINRISVIVQAHPNAGRWPKEKVTTFSQTLFPATFPTTQKEAQSR